MLRSNKPNFKFMPWKKKLMHLKLGILGGLLAQILREKFFKYVNANHNNTKVLNFTQSLSFVKSARSHLVTVGEVTKNKCLKC